MFPQKIPNKYISGMQSNKLFAAKLKLIHWVYIKWIVIYFSVYLHWTATNAGGIPKQNDITNVDNEELSIFCKNNSVNQ
jgi:uncharacterized membrane protein